MGQPRSFLGSGVKVQIKIKVKIKVKGSGQVSAPHATSTSRTALPAFVVPTSRKGREKWGTPFFCGGRFNVVAFDAGLKACSTLRA